MHLGSVFGAVVLVVCAAAFGGIGWFMYQGEQSDLENAVEVEGTVQNTSIDKQVSRRDRDDDGRREEVTTFRAVVRYTYTYEGERYTSDSVYSGPESTFDSRSGAVDVVEEYSSGETVTVHVNSEQPSRAYLIEQENSLFYFAFVGVGGLCGLAAVGSLFRGVLAD